MKKSRIILLILIFMMMFAAASTTYASDDDVELVPEVDIDSAIEPDSDEYPTYRYMFDSEDLGMLDVLPAALKSLTSGLFYFNTLIAKLVNFLLTQAFTLDIFDYISSVFDKIIQSLRDTVFTPFLSVILPLVGIGMIFYGIVSKGTKAILLFVQTIAILAMAYFFMAAPSLVITMVNDIARDMSGSTLAATAGVVTGNSMTSNDAIVNLSNIYWGTAVRNPWEVIQFGKTVSDSTAEEYLELNPGSDDREKLAKDEDNIMFKKGNQIIRLAIVLFLLIVNLIMAVLVIALAGLMFITQFAAIIAAVVAVLGLLIALLPNMGPRVAIHAIYNIFEFLLARLGITLLLCIYFAISSVFYTNVSQMGWFLVMVMQLVLIATVILYRKKIFSFVYAATKGSQAAIGAMDQRVDIKRAALETYAATKMYGDFQGMVEKRRDHKLDEKYTPTAEKSLYKQYDQEKRYAEKIARETGEPVEYSDFVTKTNARVERGFTPFSVDDVQKTTNEMKNLHKQGEDPERLIMTTVSGKTDNEVRHDQRYQEKRIAYTQENLKNAEDQNDKTYNRVIRSDIKSEHFNPRVAMMERAKQYGSETNKAIGMGIKNIVMGDQGATTEFWGADERTAPRSAEAQSQTAEAVELRTADGSTVQQTPRELQGKNNDGSTPNMQSEGTKELHSGDVVNRTVQEREVVENGAQNTINETLEKVVSTQNVDESVQNKTIREADEITNKQVNNSNETIEREGKTQNVTESTSNVSKKETNEVINKQQNTVNDVTEKNNITQNTSETIQNQTTKEQNTTSNIETVTQSNTKEITNKINNVENREIQTNEKTINETVNTNETRQTSNPSNVYELNTSRRKERFEKLNKKDSDKE